MSRPTAKHGTRLEQRPPLPEGADLASGPAALIDEIASVFHDTGRWPVWSYLDRKLDRAGIDAQGAIESTPQHLVRRSQWLRPDSDVRLSLDGLAASGRAPDDVGLFIDVLQWLVKRERDDELGSPDQAATLLVTSEDYRTAREDRDLLADDATLAKAYQLLATEGFTGSGGNNGAEWSTTVDDRVRPYRQVESLHDYRTVRSALNQDRPTQPNAFGIVGSPEPGQDPDPSRVFVVHGRNSNARDGMFDFLRALGLHPIEWSQAIRWTGKGSPYIGEVLDVAFAEARAVVVLMTPDEIAYLRPEYGSGDADPDTQPAAQARPNVLFEAGMAMGRNSDRAILVELGDVRAFSDVAGRHAVRLDNSALRRKELAQRLETAGCAVDMTGESWLTAGDLLPPPQPGGGLPLGRRLPATPARKRVKIDLRFHDRPRSGRLEIINLGTEAVYDLDLELPPNVDLQILSNDLPLSKLPPGKSAKLVAVKTNGRGPEHFDVRVVGRTEDGEKVEDDVFLSLLD